jgi:hypothetical protein
MNCDTLPESIWLDHDVPRREFERRLRILATGRDGWVTVSQCIDCGQFWRVDTWDKLQVDLAIKVPDQTTWTESDDRRARIGYLIRSYDGEDTSPCVWAGCSNLALKGIAMCADHVYDRMGVRAKGA